MLSRVLPAPKEQYSILKDQDDASAASLTQSKPTSSSSKNIPSYPNRRGFIPTEVADFGGGGAYPEIHVVQYPLNMGKPGARSTALVAVDVDEKGNAKYDAIVKQGSNRNKIVQSSLSDIKEKAGDEIALQLPSQEEEEKTAEKTRLALESLLQGKITLSKPTGITQSKETQPEFIRYTPNPNAPGYTEAAQQRVIKMVEAQVDPLEPPKHEYKKAPRGGNSPPVPVLHSPPRKLTVADQQAWKVPPCVSNWKNSKGFIIPLDKRLAADGRGLQEVTINNKFATLSEALYVAERKASDDLRVRNQIRKKMAIQEKEDREKELREMAASARMERGGLMAGVGGGGGGGTDYNSDGDGDGHYKPSFSSANHRSSLDNALGGFVYDGKAKEREVISDSDGDDKGDRRGRSRDRSKSRSRSNSNDSNQSGSQNASPNEADERGRYGETEEDRKARIQREKLRMEKRKERERELRLENMKGNMRKNKFDRDQGRDISEKIALGMHKGSGKLTGEAMFDSRLFNQSAGLSAGFGADDEYNTFTKPLFDRGEATSIYRPKKSDSDIYGDADTQMAKLTDTSKFKADKGFRGAEGGSGAGPRDAPVQFERAKDDDDEDEFGIADIVQSKKARRE